MSDKEFDAYQRAANQFWHNYLTILEKSSIPAKSWLWYWKHIEAYIDAYPGVKLWQHLPVHADKYLTAKDRKTNLPEWQFRKITDALRLLFRQLICPVGMVAPTHNPLIQRFRKNFASLPGV